MEVRGAISEFKSIEKFIDIVCEVKIQNLEILMDKFNLSFV